MVVCVGLVALVLHFFVYKPNKEQIEQLESQIVELADKVEEVERLYDEFGKTINLYLICPSNVRVLVKEFEIKSEADFCIRIAQTDLDPCNMVLNTIKTKIANNETLGEDDLQALQLLPVMCEPSQRKMMKREVFRIMNIIS